MRQRLTGPRSSGGWLLLLVLAISWLPAAAAKYEVVTGTFTVTDVVESQDWDAYEISFSGPGSVSVHVTADVTVDFYVMVASQYAEYSNPNGTGFYVVDDRENAVEFSHSTSSSGRIVVIDNADISVSGASPTGDAPYSITITYPGGSPTPTGTLLLIAAAFLFIVVLVVIVVVAIAARRTPYQPAPSTPTPPSSQTPSTFGTAPTQPYGTPVSPPTGSPPPTAGTCPRCGTPMYPHATFCAVCGHRLAD